MIKLNDLLFLSEGYCYSCMSEEYNKKYFCEDCLNLFEYVDGVKYIEERECFYPYLYTGRLKEIIKEFKFEDKSYLYRAFGELLTDYINRKNIEFDCIIPMPMAAKKLNRRGYNQSELIGEYIGKKLNIPVYTNVVKKVRNTKDQHLLPMDKRVSNLKKSLIVENIQKIKGKSVLILDDIVTSGYTLKEIINILEENNILDTKAVVIASSKIESKFKISFKNI